LEDAPSLLEDQKQFCEDSSPTQGRRGALQLDDFDVESIFSRSRPGAERRDLGRERVATQAGSFLCEVVEYSTSDTRTVLLGGVPAERFEAETSRLWLAKEIPFWGLARSRVEKRSSTVAGGAGKPAGAASKTTLTESIILSYRKARVRG
jgi:hypothetical protein